MTFSKIESPKAASATTGKAGAPAGNGASKNSELAQRQEKVSAQINARKRRLLGVSEPRSRGECTGGFLDPEACLLRGRGCGGDCVAAAVRSRTPPSLALPCRPVTVSRSQDAKYRCVLVKAHRTDP